MTQMENIINMISKLDNRNKTKILDYLNLQIKKSKKKLNTLINFKLIDKCKAITANGNQCTRKCVDTVSLYCQCHIDNPTKHINKQHKKITNQSNIDHSNLNLDDYIACTNINIDGSIYLIDKNNIIIDRKDYSVVGHYLPDKSIKWFE